MKFPAPREGRMQLTSLFKSCLANPICNGARNCFCGGKNSRGGIFARRVEIWPRSECGTLGQRQLISARLPRPQQAFDPTVAWNARLLNGGGSTRGGQNQEWDNDLRIFAWASVVLFSFRDGAAVFHCETVP